MTLVGITSKIRKDIVHFSRLLNEDFMLVHFDFNLFSRLRTTSSLDSALAKKGSKTNIEYREK